MKDFFTSGFCLKTAWSGASPSCPHLLSPPSSLCPPFSRPLLLPASRLWASSGVSTSLLAHLHPVSTFLWSRLDISSLVSSRLQSGQARLHAGGKEAYSGHLLLQLTGGAQSLLQLDISRKTLVAVSPPPGEQLDQVSVVPGHLWVLTESGSVYLQARTGQWRRLNTNQLGGARLVSLSLSEAGQVWAVDEAGQVYMRLGSLGPRTGWPGLQEDWALLH